MDRAHGIDISHHHPVTDWDALAGVGLNIFGAKATNGQAADIAFAAHRDGARQLAFDLVVYYHFPTPRSSAVAQADRLFDAVNLGGGLRPNERLALDVEYDKGVDWCPDIRFVDEFVAELVRLLPDRRPLLYSSARVWSEYLKNWPWPNAILCDLWAPRYSTDEPELPLDFDGLPLWPKWSLWQNSEMYMCPGIDGPCDHDVFRGDVDELRAFAKLAGT